MTFAKDFHAAFRVKPPALLASLATWCKAERTFIGADIELRVQSWDDVASHWNLADAAAKKLVMFCHDRMDSDYGFWLDADRSLDAAPIVYMNSEGCDCTVVASSLPEFLGLLAPGYDCIGLVAELRGRKKKKPKGAAPSYATWLATQGVAAVGPSSVLTIIDAAIKAHPSFEEWLTSNGED